MVTKPYWKGYLKLSLVNCAVTMSPATTDTGRVRFHTLSRETGARIFTRYIDSETGKTVESEDQAKGYESAEDEFVILEDDDLDAIQLESARTIDIGEFVGADTIEWIYFDSPYFVVPADDVGAEAFSVIRQAMTESGVVGISRLVMGGRERAVMLQPWDNGIVLWTLRFGDEVRNEDEYFGEIKSGKPDARMLSMVGKIIEDRTVEWSASMVKDPVQERILEIIKSKKPAKRKPQAKEVASEDLSPQSNVIDLMAALKKSLEKKPEPSKKAKH